MGTTTETLKPAQFRSVVRERFELNAVPKQQNQEDFHAEVDFLDRLHRQTPDRAVRLQNLEVRFSNKKTVEPINFFGLTWNKRHLFVVQGTSGNLGFYLIYDQQESEKRIYFYDHQPYNIEKEFRPEEVYFDRKFGSPKSEHFFNWPSKEVTQAVTVFESTYELIAV